MKKESIGYLSVRRHQELGYLGGFLVLNLHARPLEFHCTMPVKPGRSQELLYGNTLNDFVCGEQIARALIGKATLEPTAIITDCTAALAVSIVHPTKIVFLPTDPQPTDKVHQLEVPTSHAELEEITVVGHRLMQLAGIASCDTELSELLSGMAPSFELVEPFQRISEALLEAHPIAKAA